LIIAIKNSLFIRLQSVDKAGTLVDFRDSGANYGQALRIRCEQMKAMLLALSIGLAVPCMAADIREVNGATVDLQPLHDWSKSGGTPRPLPHWKEFKIASYLGRHAGYAKCVMSISGESKSTNLVANLSRDLQSKYEAAFKEHERISALRERNKAEERNLRLERMRASVSRSIEIEEVLERISQSNEDLFTASKTLALAQAELRSYSDYAMFTGKSYQGMQIWDLGRKR
jgi:hypothetical protein